MKKQLLFVAILVTALSSCSNENNDPSDNSANDGRQRILLSTGNPFNVQTKGSGSVGDADNNTWNGQTIYVSMVRRDELGYAINDQNEPIFADATATAPSGEMTGLLNAGIKYFPIDGKYDFYGYHVDDAIDATKDTGAAVEDGGNLIRYIKIDGSQDIMVAKAALTAEQEQTLTTAGKANNYFSSQTARLGVQPNMTFTHQLTQLKFQLKAGDAKAAGIGTTNGEKAVQIDSISVESMTEGKLIVVYPTAPTDGKYALFSGETSWLKLTDRNAKNIIPVKATWNESTATAEIKNIGESLMLPEANSYTIKVWTSQEDGNGIIKHPAPFTKVIKPVEAESNFKIGNSYVVLITLYGIQNIEITASLSAWVNGGDIIPLIPEDE